MKHCKRLNLLFHKIITETKKNFALFEHLFAVFQDWFKFTCRNSFYLLLWILYLHGVSLPGGGLSICEDSAIVSAQNIYGKKQDDKWDQSAYISNIWHILTWLIIRTFHNLLGAGVVHLLLGGVGRKHSIKRIGLPLWRAQTTAFIRKRAISSQTGHAGVLKMLQCLWFWTMLFIIKEDEHQQSEKALRCCVLPASQRHILFRTFQLQITDQGRLKKCSFSRRLLALPLTWEQSRMRDSMGH